MNLRFLDKIGEINMEEKIKQRSNRMVKNIYCKRCGHKVVRETCKELKKTYPFYCANCDEDMFRFETYKKGKR